jgi:hypothetical protein
MPSPSLMAAVQPAPPSEQRFSTRTAAFAGAAIVILFTFWLGWYGCQLNHVFYSQQGPFFDSISYYNAAAEVHSIAREQGAIPAIRKSLELETVVMPWIMTAIVAPFVPLKRDLGVWIQTSCLLLLGLSVYWYLLRYRSLPWWLAAIASLPFLAFGGIFYFNGGISDFRMDLSLYTFLAIMGTWYLASRETGSRWPWIFAGIAAGAGSLFRATLPIYAMLMFGPPILARLIQGHDRKRVLTGLAWITAMWILIAAVPYGIKFDQLYYYYAVWNIDANMKLPWSQSSMHFPMAWSHVGKWFAWALGAACLVSLISARPRRMPDVALLWMALSVPLFLAWRGAGPNPFVTMPAMFGLIMFAVQPWRDRYSLSYAASVAIAILLTAGVMMEAASAPMRHLSENVFAPRMAPLRQMIALIENDMKQQGRTTAAYAAPFIGRFHVRGLKNVMIFDYGYRPENMGARSPDGRWLAHERDYEFTAPVLVSWQRDIPGSTDEEKIQTIVKLALDKIDYLIVPDEKSLTFLEQHRAHNFIHSKTRAIVTRALASGRYQRLGGDIEIAPEEVLHLYVQRGVNHGAQP